MENNKVTNQSLLKPTRLPYILQLFDINATKLLLFLLKTFLKIGFFAIFMRITTIYLSLQVEIAQKPLLVIVLLMIIMWDFADRVVNIISNFFNIKR